jgi:hypothetical protein
MRGYAFDLGLECTRPRGDFLALNFELRPKARPLLEPLGDKKDK